MKIKLLVKLGEMILRKGEGFSGEEPRADMYLPIWLLAFAILLMTGGVIMCIFAIIRYSVGVIVASVIAAFLGVLALLCWKNQTVTMLSDDTFEYSTFLGNKKVYSFSDIRGLKRNNDSMTLYVADGKVHMEACAIITDRLADRIDEQLKAVYGDEQ